MLKHTIDPPLPAVIGACEAVATTAFRPGKPCTAMPAGVVERTHRPIFLADHDDRFMPEVVHRVVAGLRHFGQPSTHMPDTGPHMVPLALHEVCRCIAVTGNRITAQLGCGAAIQIVEICCSRHGFYSCLERPDLI